MAELEVIILAAGQGTRMKSRLPKVLHPLAGKPMLMHVVQAAEGLGASKIHVVYGHGGDAVKAAMEGADITWALQTDQNGTGHAVRQAMPAVDDAASVLILYGDVPLVDADTLKRAVASAEAGRLAVVSARVSDPSGYGRILRNANDDVVAIREHKDATPQERDVDEINSGIMAAPAAALRRWLDALKPNNTQGELYLTDIVELALADNVVAEGVIAPDEDQISGVNDRVQLARLERVFQRRAAEQLMLSGVTLADPLRLDIRGTVETGGDVTIDVNVVLEGRVVLGAGCRIGPNCVIRDAVLGADVEVLPNSIIEEARVGDRARVGPFARLRPEAELGNDVHVGNFVEIKKSVLADGAKVNHLSYVGDSDIGRRVNVGAGTITCNYDGANKHRTVIGDDAFIGSGTELVAPVTVGAGATIGAGSTISRDAPGDALTLTRAKQRSIDGWQRPKKKPKP
jgi:bifunctional UDP-N-acetylglucosamine pyrophosphorylase/glucosamine-1-phosphate N-acetyltransferase